MTNNSPNPSADRPIEPAIVLTGSRTSQVSQAPPQIDYQPAIDHLTTVDPVLSSIIAQVGDCTLDRQQQTGDLLASLAESILYQQLSGKAAAAIHRRFLQLYGGQQPTAAQILATPDDDLRSAGISRSKVIYLKDLAQTVQNGLPSLDVLAGYSDEAIVQLLTPIKGIGRWTVEMLLIFRLHRWDVLPVDDLGIRSGIRRAYDLPELPPKKLTQQIGQPWQPYRTIAAWYLWRSLG